MNDFSRLQQKLMSELALPVAPIAIDLYEQAPADLEKFAGSVAAGCSFWRLAASGKGFYTEAADHFNCAIGSYTHGIDLPAHRADELPGTLGFMFDQGYLREEEVAGIPRLDPAPAYVAYRPLAICSDCPDIVLLRGPAAKLMLAQEAATRAGVAVSNSPLLGRPTCMAIPAALQAGSTASSGCIGNRVYTEMDDGELYLAVPGRDMPALVDALPTINAANRELAAYHRGRREQLERAG